MRARPASRHRPRCALALVLVASGCTHTHVVSTDAGAPAYAEASRRTAGRSAEVLMRDGQLYRWRDVRFTPDSVFGTPVATGVPGRVPGVPLADVVEVQSRSRGRGALEGAVIGFGIGAIIGVITGPDENCAAFYGPCAETTTQQAAIFGVGGAFWGVIIGAIRATRHRIVVR